MNAVRGCENPDIVLSNILQNAVRFEMEEIIMSVKVAINGFGRIGHLAFRQMFGAEGFEVRPVLYFKSSIFGSSEE